MDERAVIKQAQRGDENALAKLYENHREQIFRLACLYSQSQEDAEDILHETFIKAFRSIKSYKEIEGVSFVTWINRICINHALDHLRKQKREMVNHRLSLEEMGIHVESGDNSPDKSAEMTQILRLIQKAVHKLTPKQQVIFDLRYTQHWSIEEIAELSKCSMSNVKNQLFRSLAKLRKHLAQVLEES